MFYKSVGKTKKCRANCFAGILSFWGSSSWELVDKITHIKQSYDKLLTKYEALMLENVASTKEAIETYKEADDGIKASFR